MFQNYQSLVTILKTFDIGRFNDKNGLYKVRIVLLNLWWTIWRERECWEVERRSGIGWMEGGLVGWRLLALCTNDIKNNSALWRPLDPALFPISCLRNRFGLGCLLSCVHRLYSKGRVLGHKRAKRNTRPNTSLIQIEGVATKEDAQYYLGKVRIGIVEE